VLRAQAHEAGILLHELFQTPPSRSFGSVSGPGGGRPERGPQGKERLDAVQHKVIELPHSKLPRPARGPRSAAGRTAIPAWHKAAEMLLTTHESMRWVVKLERALGSGSALRPRPLAGR
jgi:hypothetical protein